LAQKLGQLQPFLTVPPPERMGRLCTFWATLTHFSHQHPDRDVRWQTTQALLGLGRITRFVLPLIRFLPSSLTYSVPLFLKRQCDRTLGAA
jgi:hypothetical protein